MSSTARVTPISSPWQRWQRYREMPALLLQPTRSTSINRPESVWDSCEHVKGDESSEVSLPTSLTRSRLSPDKGVVSHGFPKRPVSGTESTMELMADVSKVDSRRSSSSLASNTIDAVSTFSFEEATPREVYTLPIELATQRTEDTAISRTTTKESTNRRSVESPRLQVSEQDIEMAHMTFPRPGMDSTDNLVPSQKQQKMDSISSWENSSASASVDVAKSGPPTSPGLLPDYKPVPLRWPFQLLLVMIVAGTFAFFEHQIHNLPPVRYKMFHVDPPEMRSAGTPGAVQAEASDVNSPLDPYHRASPVSRISCSAPVTAWTNPTGSPGQAFGGAVRIAAPIPDPIPDPTPDPTPAPRPPESLYPGPFKYTSTYCGWAPPVWVLYTRVHHSSYSDGIGLGTPQTMVVVEQTFPTFWSKNETWCPCLVDVDRSYTWWTVSQWTSWPWTSGWATRTAGPDFWVSTHDKDCHSILSALSYFNLEQWHTTVPADSLIIPLNIQDLTTQLTVSEHPVSQMPWPWPTTDSEAQVSVPFLVKPRTKIFQPDQQSVEDEFGNTDLPDFFMNAWTSTADGFSLMWWSLPFARPLQTPTTTTASESTMTGGFSSSDSSVSSNQQTSTVETATEPTEIQGQSLPSTTWETSTTEEAGITSEGSSESSSTKEEITSIPSAESETKEVKLSTTVGGSSIDTSLPASFTTSVRMGTTIEGHVGKE